MAQSKELATNEISRLERSSGCECQLFARAVEAPFQQRALILEWFRGTVAGPIRGLRGAPEHAMVGAR
jgi:hypothetical protein